MRVGEATVNPQQCTLRPPPPTLDLALLTGVEDRKGAGDSDVGAKLSQDLDAHAVERSNLPPRPSPLSARAC